MHPLEQKLETLMARLPEIRQILGEARWPAFAARLQVYAPSFQNLAQEAELKRAVAELLKLFLEDPQIEMLIIQDEAARAEGGSPLSGNRQYGPGYKEPARINVPEITARFYQLCQEQGSIALAGSHEQGQMQHDRAAPASPAERVAGQRVAQAGADQPE